jgi:type IX secretion system PorP/SprF family membrane protein
MKNSLYILSIFTLLSGSILAQQIEYTNLYEFNKLKINPAYAGATTCGNVSVGHLYQWAGFEGAPQTSYVNGSGHIGKNMGLGGKVSLDRLGSLTQFNIQGVYSYKLNFGDDHNLRLGIGAGVNQQNFNFAGSTIGDISDVALITGTQKGLTFYSDAGLVYTLKGFQLSFSLPNLVETNTDLAPTQGVLRNVRHMIGYMHYRIGDPSKVTVTPSVLYKNSALQLHQLEGNVLLNVKEKFQFGVGYRHKAGVLGRIGFSISDLVQIRYAYEFPLTDIARATSGSHEVGIGLKLCKKGKDIEPIERVVTKTDTVFVAQEPKIDTVFVEKVVEITGPEKEKIDLTHTIFYEHAISDFDKTKEDAALTKIATYLIANRDQVIYIRGYASESGSDFTNFNLAGERAKKVFAYLLAKGVQRNQMISIVQGEVKEHHGADHTSDEKESRRVLIEIK